MASTKDESTSDDVGLGNGDPSNDDPSSVENITCKSVKLEESMAPDLHDHSGKSEAANLKKEIEINRPTDNNRSGPPRDEPMQTEEFYDEAIVKSDEDEDVMIDSEINTTEPANSVTQDHKLLSEISELVGQTQQQVKNNESAIVHEAENEFDSLNEVTNSNVEDVEKMEEEFDETNNITNVEQGSSSSHTEEDNNAHGDSKNNLSNVDSSNQLSTSEGKKPKESPIQRLANLGLIAEEKPLIEDKESILKKLASRGGISIMPTGSMASPVSSVVSIKPASVKPVSMKPSPVQSGSLKPVSVESLMAKPELANPNPNTDLESPTKTKYKPGPRSAKKKIKIDPGKSLDIDKDFNSLINFLSAGTDVSSTSVTSSTSEEKNGSGETVTPTEKVNDLKPETQLEVGLNETSNQSTNDGHVSGMDVDVNNEKSPNESEIWLDGSVDHDGSKFEQRSENEGTPMINKNKNVIDEGSAEILLSSNKNVFYNKVQEFNRDMSIAALTVFSEMHQRDPRTRNRGKKRKTVDSNEADSSHADEGEEKPGKRAENGITILEALSATGLRSIRYAREIPGVKEVIANDLSEDAVDTIKKNVEHNGVGEMVTTSMSDASLLMYQRAASQEWYDAIDLDPYGCPARFLDAAVQAVRDGGLLLVTCTDMAILAGNSPESCYVKYGAVSLRSPACHEMALRIALQCIESHANRYGRYIVPLLSFSADFYIRLIVEIYTSPVTCKRTTSKLAMVYQCIGCGTHTLHALGNTTQVSHKSQVGSGSFKFTLPHGPPVGTSCYHCQYKHNIGGPIWTAPLYCPKFVENMLKVVEKGKFATGKRMQGMLEVIREELPDVPLYYTISGLCTKLHCQAIPLIDIRSAILNAGYRVSSSHTAPTAIKTNAPPKTIWDIMRCWVHMNPVSQKRLIAGSVAAAIILEPPNLIANFDIHPRARPSSALRKLVRYQQNPEKNWGPGTRARCNNAEDGKDDKRRMNQNKKTKKHIDIIEVVTIDDEDETTEVSKTETATTPSPSGEKE